MDYVLDITNQKIQYAMKALGITENDLKQQ